MDIYELLNEIIPSDEKWLHSTKFTEDCFNTLNEKLDQELFALFRNIASLGVSFEGNEIKFSPQFEYHDCRRTFSIDDLTEDDYKLLYALEFDKLPLLLQARISLILWVQKKDYKMALKAAACYHELFLVSFSSTNWSACYKFLSFSVKLSSQINSKDYPNYLQEISDKIIELNGEDSSLLSILLAELLLSQKRWNEFDAILPAISNIISNSMDSVAKAKRAYNLKTKIYFKQGNPALAMENNRKLASYLEAKATGESGDNIQSLFHAEQYLQEAIHLFRNNGVPEEGERAHCKLLEIQKRIPQYMIPITVSGNMTQEHEKVEALFEELSFKECLMRIAQCTPLYKKDFLKKKVLEEAADPLSCLFGSGIKSSQGRTIVEIPPIDMQEPEANMEILEKHMHHTALLLEEIYGSTILKWAGDIFNTKFQFTAEDLEFLVKNNPIIPAGRENIFLAGLYHGLKGEIYISLHILAPQVENLFRCIAENAGAIMTTLKDDDTSDAKLLTSIFDTPELVECYDNDVLFLLKGLLNEKTGANIRNEIAHGLMGEQKGCNGAARFFLCWVLRLLSYTSGECQEILITSENLQKESK